MFAPALSGVLEVSWAGPTGAVIGSFDIASDLLASRCGLSFPQVITPDEFLCLLKGTTLHYRGKSRNFLCPQSPPENLKEKSIKKNGTPIVVLTGFDGFEIDDVEAPPGSMKGSRIQPRLVYALSALLAVSICSHRELVGCFLVQRPLGTSTLIGR